MLTVVRSPPLNVGLSVRVKRLLALAPLLALLAVFFVWPVLRFLTLGVVDPKGSINTDAFNRVFFTPLYATVLLNTLKVAFWTAVLSVVGGYPVAYLLASMSADRRGKYLIWVLLPFWTSALIRTFSWIVILGRNGPVNKLALATGLTDAPMPLLQNFGSVLIGMTHALMPLAVLTMLPVMQDIPPALTKAAATLGARGGQTFWRIYFPLSMPGVAASGLTVFITALGFFITPTLLGGPADIILPQVIIESIQTTLNWGLASALSIFLLLVSLVIFVVYDRVFGIATLSGSAAGRRASKTKLSRAGKAITSALGSLSDRVGLLVSRQRSVRRQKNRVAWLRGIVIALLAFLTVPSFFIVAVSFTEQGFINWPPVGFTFKWYDEVLHSSLWAAAALRSLLVALGTATAATVIGTAAAFVLMRTSFFGKTAVFLLALMPAILPRIIIAAASFYLFAQIGLVGTAAGLVIGHTVIALPYVVITMMAVLKTYDSRLDLAAATLGATDVQTLRRITLPLLRPGIVSAFLFSFIVSLDELPIALFITGGLSATIPKQMWDEAVLKISPSLAAVSGIMLVVLTLTIVLSEAFRRRAVRA